MPLVYADTSTLFASFHPRDEFALPVMEAVRKIAPDFIYWSFLRYELRHNLRQARINAHGETAWRALRAAERTQARLRWQPDLKCEFVLESADELSAQASGDFAVGSGDLIHVAAARRLKLRSDLDAFWTCDEDQSNAAKAAGLRVRLFKI